MNALSRRLAGEERGDLPIVSEREDLRAAPRILFSTTNRWASDVSLPRMLRRSGAEVAMLCPPGHPARAARLEAFFTAGVFRPVASLRRAIAAFRPDLVVPGDERARRAMHLLHASGTAAERALVERSLGPPSSYDLLLSRQGAMVEVAAAGIPVPELVEDAGPAALAAWMRDRSGPVVLKADGTWAGEGVRIVRDVADVEAACAALLRPPLRSAVKRVLVNGDMARLADCLSGQARTLSAQSYVAGGRVGDVAAFCRAGEVLAIVTAEREAGLGELGPSTIVRIVHRPVLEAGVRRFVRRLGLSGFVGFDFMIDPESGIERVIEVNPRATALASIRPPHGISPAAAAAGSLGAVRSGPEPSVRDLVAYFPKAWTEHPNDGRLSLCAEDMPGEEPALVRALLQTPRTERGWRVTLWNALSARRGDGPAAGKTPADRPDPDAMLASP